MIHERQLRLFGSKRQRGKVADYSPSEFQLHCAISDLLRRWAMPNWFWCHYPAGEERTEAAGARLKRMGVIPGISDLILFPPAGAPEPHCHFLELKRRGGKLTESQAAFQLWARLNGYPFEVANSFDAALAILQRWRVVRTTIKVSA